MISYVVLDIFPWLYPTLSTPTGKHALDFNVGNVLVKQQPCQLLLVTRRVYIAILGYIEGILAWAMFALLTACLIDLC